MNIRKQPTLKVLRHIGLSFLLVFILLKTGYTQTDSAYYDLGRTVLRKDFTPVVTITGEELQRFFYADVRDAIIARVGVMQNLVFVVDGLIVNDINTYSVFDIQEVVVMEQAVIATHGAFDSELLVLVTTHRRDEKAGSTLTAAAKAGWIGEPGNSLYQQYYAGARYTGQKLDGGVSLDYLRDGATPFEDRYKARVFGRYNVAPGHRLHAEVSYTPNRERTDSLSMMSVENTPMNRSWQYNADQTAWQSRLGLSSRFSERFENEFTAAYVWSDRDQRSDQTINFDRPDALNFQSIQQSGYMTRHLLISDRLRYKLAVGDNLVVVPQLHAGWRKGEVLESRFTASRQLDGGMPLTVSKSSSRFEISLLTFTPSVDVTLWKAVNVHGGAVIGASPDVRLSPSKQSKRIFPYVAAATDVIKLFSPDSRWSGVLTTSYAQPGNFYDNFSNAAQWNVLTGMLSQVMPGQLAFSDVEGRNDRITVRAELANKDRGFSVYYGFSRFNNNSLVLIPMMLPGIGGLEPVLSPLRLSTVSSLHSLNLTKRWTTETWTFQTGARATRQSGKGKFFGDGFEFSNPDEFVAFSSDAMYFVQWNNALTWGRFFAGVDAFYHRDPIAIRIGQLGPEMRKRETVSLQHVHAGYRVALANGRQLEVYGYTRSALENNDAPFSSRYKYYGVGLRLQCAR